MPPKANHVAEQIAAMSKDELTNKLDSLLCPSDLSKLSPDSFEMKAQENLRETNMYRGAMQIAEALCVTPKLAMHIIREYYVFAFVNGAIFGAALEAERREVGELEKLVKE